MWITDNWNASRRCAIILNNQIRKKAPAEPAIYVAKLFLWLFAVALRILDFTKNDLFRFVGPSYDKKQQIYAEQKESP